jgi:hypothetical protein
MNSAVLLASLHHSVTIDVARQSLTLVSRNLLFVPEVKIVTFEEIEQVYLDYLEKTYTDGDRRGAQERIERRWSIFLLLRDGQILTVDEETTCHSPGETFNLTWRSRYWENLATRICELTGKTLIRTPSVPGSVHTFVENVDQIIQRRLAQSHLRNRRVHLRSGEDGSLEIVVDGKIYRGVDEVEDKVVRDLIRASVDEWQANDVRVPSVPNGPRTFVESIDRILQHRLVHSQLHSRSVRLRSGKDGSLEIVVDGRIYGSLDEVEDEDARALIRASVDEWEAI